MATPKPEKRKRDGHCFVTGCTTGYRSNKKKASLFSAPRDEELRKKWAESLPPRNRKFEKQCAVCENHFSEIYIERHYRHIINGEEVLIQRGIPILKRDAVPTLFTNRPKHLADHLAKKMAASKRAKKSRIEKVSQPTVIHCSPAIVLQEKNSISRVSLPTEHWVKIPYRFRGSKTAFALWTSPFGADFEAGMSFAQPNKVVVAQEMEKEVLCQVYISNVKTKELSIPNDGKALEEVLNETNITKGCKGVGKRNEFPDLIKGKIQDVLNVVNGSDLRSKTCTGSVNVTDTCLSCKHIRRRLLNLRLKQKVLPAKKIDFKTELKTCIRDKNRLQKKIVLLKERIRNLKKQKCEHDENLVDIENLPEKQQLAIREAIKASKRKSNHGMPYDSSWIIECMLMRIKSPKLYEYMRNSNILTLPSKATLHRQFSLYKNGVSSDENVVSEIPNETILGPEFLPQTSEEIPHSLLGNLE